MMDKINDKILLKKIRSSDSVAFEELLLKYDKRLYNIAYNILKDEMLSQDAVIETFEQFLSKCHTIRKADSLKSWLSITAQRKALNILKKNQKVCILEDEKLEYLIDKNNTNSLDSVEKIHIRECLSQLSEDQYEALMLKNEGLTLHEIGGLMGLSMAKVRGHIEKAKENFIKFYN